MNFLHLESWFIKLLGYVPVQSSVQKCVNTISTAREFLGMLFILSCIYLVMCTRAVCLFPNKHLGLHARFAQFVPFCCLICSTVRIKLHIEQQMSTIFTECEMFATLLVVLELCCISVDGDDDDVLLLYNCMKIQHYEQFI